MTDSATFKHIGVSRAGVITVIEIRRGPNNFVDTDMVAEIADVLEDMDRTRDCRAIVLCAEGKHFCAGADFSNRGADGVALGGTRGRHLYKEAQRLWRTGKPIVAVVQGAAVGAGLGLAVMADFRVTCPEARFSANFTRLGFHPGFGLTATLPRLVGMQTALEWCYTGRVFGAEEAQARGLVRSLHAPEDLLPAARALAREIADNTAPVSIALTRQLLWRMAGADQPMEAHRADSRAIQSRGASADAAEGVTAFLEKRTPHYPNRVSSDLPDIWPDWKARDFS